MAWWLGAAWFAFLAAFYASHRRVRAATAGKPENRVRRERSSDGGMALQFVSVALVLFVPGPWRAGMLLPGMLTAAVSIAWLWRSLRHLGRQWRVQAVVTDDHELITTGPYGLVRHPVYLAFLGMLVATALLRGYPVVCLAAVAVFAVGTEIRVRAEERLLSAAFGERFAAYAGRTRWAYVPGLR